MSSFDRILQTAENMGLSIESKRTGKFPYLAIRVAPGQSISEGCIRIRFVESGAIYEAEIDDPKAHAGYRVIRGGLPPVLEELRSVYIESLPYTPASAPDRGTDAFDEIERSDTAAAQFERDPQNRGSIEPARMPSRSQLESREVGPVAVDEIGPESARSFEISLWDNDEGEFVHAMMLPNREAAEALLHALGKLLLG